MPEARLGVGGDHEIRPPPDLPPTRGEECANTPFQKPVGWGALGDREIRRPSEPPPCQGGMRPPSHPPPLSR